MYISPLKKWLSYLYDINLESLNSALSGEIKVILSKGRLQLVANNAIYSFADLYYNFRKVFESIDFKKQSIQKVLTLGMGLGSIPYMLEKVFKVRALHVCVEIDADIIYLFSKYVASSIKSKIEIYNVDALDFFDRHNDKNYNLICIDIFIDDKIPSPFLEKIFLERVKCYLSKDGILIFNHLGGNTTSNTAAITYFEKIFKNVFPAGCYNVQSQNVMLISDSTKCLF